MPGEIAAFVQRTTAASGVPERLEDPAAIERVAMLLRANEEGGPRRSRRPEPDHGRHRDLRAG
jgi:hypothetical protein